MLANCANPACARQFHQLDQGRLYLLPPDDRIVERLSEYCYWLCLECSIRFALTRHEGRVALITKKSRDVHPPMQLLMSGRWDWT